MFSQNAARILTGVVLGVGISLPFSDVVNSDLAFLLILGFSVLFFLSLIYMFHYANTLAVVQKSCDRAYEENRRLRKEIESLKRKLSEKQ